MSDIVTLTLAPEVAERARKAADRTGQPIEEILTEWLAQASVGEDVYRLRLDVQYEIWSPFDSGDAAAVLQKALDEDRDQQDT